MLKLIGGLELQLGVVARAMPSAARSTTLFLAKHIALPAGWTRGGPHCPRRHVTKMISTRISVRHQYDGT
jgi:hypothetical protein